MYLSNQHVLEESERERDSYREKKASRSHVVKVTFNYEFDAERKER